MTALTKAETVKCACLFFRARFGRDADEAQEAFFRKATDGGLTIAEFIAALDYARALELGEAESWQATQNACRWAWKIKKRLEEKPAR